MELSEDRKLIKRLESSLSHKEYIKILFTTYWEVQIHKFDEDSSIGEDKDLFKAIEKSLRGLKK